jgi:hypothetical protein
MLYIDNENDSAMRFEAVAIAAFNNCNKGADPWGYASQDKYSVFVSEPISLDAKRMLSTILIKLIWDNQNSSFSEELMKLDNQIWKAKTQNDIIAIIDKTINLLLANNI